MATAEVESKWLSEILLKILQNGKLVDDYVPEKLNTFQIKELNVDFISKEEAFMLTVCYRAKVHFIYDNRNFTNHLVVKKTPQIEPEDYVSINFHNLFSNEIHAYTKIFPALEKFSGEKHQGPRLLYSELREYYAALVMDDFGASGWQVAKPRYDLDLEHTLQAVKALGKFHGTTYAFKHEQPAQFEELISSLAESRYHSEIQPIEWLTVCNTSIIRWKQVTKKYFKEIDEKFIDTLADMQKSLYKLGVYLVKPHEPLATICHGDFLRNNVAYKYDGEKPVDLMMFDLQTIRYSSPMVDYTLFLSLSTFTKTRVPNFDLLFDTYTEAINSQYTKLTKQEAPEFLQRDKLLHEYIRIWLLSFTACGFFLMMLIDPESSPSLEGPKVPEEEIAAAIMKAAGEPYDKEVSHQVKEFYDLCQRHKIDLRELYADF